MHWTERMLEVGDAQGLTRADIAKRAGISPGLVRQYVSARTDNPRGDKLLRIARALGVEYLWLRDGLGPKYPGDDAGDDVEKARARLEAQREFGGRVRQRREDLGLSVARCVSGLAVTRERWTAIENGSDGPDLIELQVIAERLRENLDWLVSGIVVPEGGSFNQTADAPPLLHEKQTGFAPRLPRPSKK